MVGTYQKMLVKKLLPFGAILGEEEILLPQKYVDRQLSVGDEVEVFVYTDSEDRIIATTDRPFGILKEIVCLQVVDIVANGVYLDLGLAKDIFMPTQRKLCKGEFVVVQITLDKQGRLLARSNLEFQKCLSYPRSNHLEAIPYQKTPMGWKCVVEKKFSGLLFANEVFSQVVLFQPLNVGIKKLRKDGKLDLKYVQTDVCQKILELLRANGGRIAVNTDSPPDQIYQICQMSKKKFKATLNTLAQEVGQDEYGSYLK
ncbi:hypothetical protein BBW65_06190 [Helicobacter enhydrae]|uniref:RNA-binding protein n=1 Tax=Helicobacter enhydrae TaxID=222136 RepID=A0A1B1U6L9_9HELI|nr:S1-like domain-containing RNA-binding protein [Helicobacter enhydrae]ANV98408.1 hypothetical protein BBW65_06190 [Helicobacter enhydrae]